MNRQASEVGAVVVGLMFLGALGWSMTSLSFDIWGAMLLAPIYALIGFALVRRMFRHELHPVAITLSWGMLFKLGGAFARYWVGFEAYDGSIDAGRYHAFARLKAAEIWSGDRSWIEVIPTKTGTEFVDEFTAFVYTITGGSQLGGFVTFSFLAWIGIVFFVKAAATAIPGLPVRKYAWLCVIAPSLVYWPSSIGKEAIVLFGLGVGTYGIARLLAVRTWTSALLVMFLGLGFTAVVRPHMAGIWVAALLPGLVLATVLGSRAPGRTTSRFATFTVLGLAAAGFAIIARLTIQFLQPANEDEASSVTDILEETTRRTLQAGSNFTPPSITNPINWPYAMVRTLTRPLPIEASGFAQLVTAVEVVALLALITISWRRVRQLPKLLVSNPYVLFAVSALALASLAYSSLANLGVLSRQKSLLFPFMLLLPCIPRPFALEDEPEQDVDDVSTETEHPLGSLRRRSEPAHDDSAGTTHVLADDFWAGRSR